MTEGANANAVLFADLMHVLQEFSNLVYGNNHVHFIEMLGVGLDYRKECAAGSPYGTLVVRVGKNQRVECAKLVADFCQRFCTLEDFVLVVTVKGYQDIRTNFMTIYISWDDLVAGIVGRRVDDVALHEFNGLRIETSKLDLRNSANGSFEILEGKDEANVFLRNGDELKGEFGDNTQRALRADHQVKKAIARAGLGNRTTDFHDFARGKNHGHCQHVIARGAVLNSTHAASIGAYVAAQRAGFLAGIRGIHKIVLKGVCSQIAQANAGLNANEQVVHVVLEDFIHVHGGKQTASGILVP